MVLKTAISFLICVKLIVKFPSQTNVYEIIQDENDEELLSPRQTRREATATDSFYDLLQAVN